MNEETKKAIEAEFARCELIESAFRNHEAFVLLAIIRGWTLEEAKAEFEKRKHCSDGLAFS